MPKVIVLVRHGETAWSLAGRHTGRTDLPLTARGARRAGQLGAALAPCRPFRVFTSPLRRAQETCTLAGCVAAARTEPDLREWDYGDYEGLTTPEIHQVHPGWNLFRDGCPAGESVADVADRADRLLGRLRGLDGTLVLFSHGHFLRTLAARWLGLPVPAGRQLTLSTGSVSLLGFEHPDGETPAITLWNAGPDWLGRLPPGLDEGRRPDASGTSGGTPH